MATVKRALRQDRDAGAMTAPRDLIPLLMEEALGKLAAARGDMHSGAAVRRHYHIQWAMAIIGALQDALERGGSGPAAQRLDALYDYMHGQLFRADRDNDAALLDEVVRLLGTVRRDREWLGLHRDRTAHEPCGA